MMTEKRFYLMNVEDEFHEYGRWCKPVLEDGETGKQYEDALDLMELLNRLHEEKEQLKQQLELYGEIYPNGKWITELTSEELKKELEE
jgi:hypothetical protein